MEARNTGVDELHVQAGAEVVDLAGTADDKGQVIGTEGADLIAKNVRLDHFTITNVLHTRMEITDPFKGVGI